MTSVWNHIFEDLLDATQPKHTLHPKKHGTLPYDIIKDDEKSYTIRVAAAGFKKENIKVAVVRGVLEIVGKPTEDEKVTYISRGISNREFRLRFTLHQKSEVFDATFKDGVLEVRIVVKDDDEIDGKFIEIK